MYIKIYRPKNMLLLLSKPREEPPDKFPVCIVSLHLSYQLYTGGHTQKEQRVATKLRTYRNKTSS